MDWLVDWLIGWLNDWLSTNGWSVGWLSGWRIDLKFEWWNLWIDGFYFEWFDGMMWLSSLIHRIDPLIHLIAHELMWAESADMMWSIDWGSDWWIHWFSDDLIRGFIDLLIGAIDRVNRWSNFVDLHHSICLIIWFARRCFEMEALGCPLHLNPCMFLNDVWRPPVNVANVLRLKRSRRP